MATKTISITLEAYERLRSWKEKNESFSEVINKIGRKHKLMAYAGILSGKSAAELEKRVKEGRERSRMRMHQIQKGLQ